jgi:hypothetical protein
MRFEIPPWIKYEIEERWQRIIEWGDNNPRILWGICAASVGIFILTIIILAWPDNPRPDIDPGKKAWFYDQNTGKLFKAKDKQIGPIKAPSGYLPNGEPAGVRAYVYTYENEPNENELIIGYLEKPDPCAPQSDDVESILLKKGKLVRTVDDDEWISTSTKRGKIIINEVTTRDEKGRIPSYHRPK